jgi:hypothetical protein
MKSIDIWMRMILMVMKMFFHYGAVVFAELINITDDWYVIKKRLLLTLKRSAADGDGLVV